MTFEFATANRILFGPGRVKELPDHARNNGRSALLVTGRGHERSEASRRLLLARGISVIPFNVEGEPTIECVKEGAAQTRYHTCDQVIAFGGGSVIDAGKAIAALATNRRPALDYLEVIGKGEPLDTRPLPVIAVPTTAGAGAEVTRNAVLTSSEEKFKVSLRHPWMLPAIALLDPHLTHSLPPALTAATGLDALSQLIEPFVSARANPLTDAICREGISLAARSLEIAFHKNEPAARKDMMLASLFGGLALANAGLGAVHGFAAPLGAMFDAPHGAICAALLPGVMRANIQAAREISEKRALVERYDEIARRLTGNPAATAEDGALWVQERVSAFGLPKLSAYKVTQSQLPAIIAKAKNASSMKANPIEFSDAQLNEILQRSL
jgi:alcohol dehydrogenase class IV